MSKFVSTYSGGQQILINIDHIDSINIPKRQVSFSSGYAIYIDAPSFDTLVEDLAEGEDKG